MALAFIPYAAQPSVSIGPLTVHAFGVIVALSVWIGLAVGKRRFEAVGLDAALGERMAWWALVGGFVGAHVFSVLFYFPHEIRRDPMMVLRVWENISSFGGMLGGFIGILLFFRLRMPTVDARSRLIYLDVAAFVFPISLAVGRIACSLAHDHPGTITRFPLAVSLEGPEAQSYISRVYENAGRAQELPSTSELATMGFHDLGWYEFLYLAVVVVPITFWFARRQRRPGFFLVSFGLSYAPVRFVLDFLRVADATYLGLTPAQFAALFIAAAALVTMVGWSRGARVAAARSGGAERTDGSTRANGDGGTAA